MSEGVESQSNEPDRQAIRRFSKEHLPEERYQTAEEINASRGEHFRQKEELHKRIAELEQRSKETGSVVDSMVQEVSSIETELANIKNSRITQLLEFFNARQLEKQLGKKRQTQVEALRDYSNTKDLLDDLRRQQFNRSQLENAKRKLHDFYRGAKERWNEYEAEQRERDVGNIASKYQALFLHGISPRGWVAGNTVLLPNVGWDMKVKILMALEPTISVSTLRTGETGLVSSVGVVLSGGHVESAHIQDAGTVVENFGRRRATNQIQNEIPIAEQIEKVVQTRRPGVYNELVVKDPKVGGLFVSWDLLREREDSDKTIAAAKALGLPLFVIKGGNAFEANEPYPGRLELGRQAVPAELVEKSNKMTPAKRELYSEEILENNPFRIRTPELSYIDERASGKELYIGLFGEVKQNEIAGILLEEGVPKEIKGIAQIQGIGRRHTYTVQAGKLFRSTQLEGQMSISNYVRKPDDPYLLNRPVIMQVTEAYNEMPIRSVDQYLLEMSDAMTHVRQQLRDGRDILEENSRDPKVLLNSLAFHAYGFGEQAKEWGDSETYEKAFALAATVLSKEAYQEILDRRVSKTGTFKATKADWPSA